MFKGRKPADNIRTDRQMDYNKERDREIKREREYNKTKT